MRWLLGFIVSMAAIGALGVYAGRLWEYRSLEPSLKELDECRTNAPLRRFGSVEYAGLSQQHQAALLKAGHLREQRFGKETLHMYDLRSFDHGKNWVAVQEEGDEVTILGAADQVFPGLVQVLDEWDTVLKSIRVEVVPE